MTGHQRGFASFIPLIIIFTAGLYAYGGYIAGKTLGFPVTGLSIGIIFGLPVAASNQISRFGGYITMVVFLIVIAFKYIPQYTPPLIASYLLMVLYCIAMLEAVIVFLKELKAWKKENKGRPTNSSIK